MLHALSEGMPAEQFGRVSHLPASAAGSGRGRDAYPRPRRRRRLADRRPAARSRNGSRRSPTSSPLRPTTSSSRTSSTSSSKTSSRWPQSSSLQDRSKPAADQDDAWAGRGTSGSAMVGDDLVDHVVGVEPPAHAEVGAAPVARLQPVVHEVIQRLPQRPPRARAHADGSTGTPAVKRSRAAPARNVQAIVRSHAGSP